MLLIYPRRSTRIEAITFVSKFEKLAKRNRQTRTEYVIGFSALLTGVFFFTGANAVLTTLVVLRASELGFSQTIIGFLTSCYFGGFIAGCLYGGKLVSRIGHIRTFAGLAGLATMCALLYPILPVAAAWIVLRAVSGFSHSILQMTIESWLTSSSTSETLSGFISSYRIIDLLSVTLAQFALILKDAGPFLLFSLIAISIVMSLTPIVFSKTTGPTNIAQTKPDLPRLIQIAPMAAAGALIAGFVSAGFWGLSPVFLTSSDFNVDVVALFISAVILGGAVVQWPIGKLSDKYDRRLVIIGGAAMGAVICLLMPFVAFSQALVLILGAMFGGALLPIYALAVSHASDHADTEEFVSVAGAVLLSFGAGAVLGPTVFSIMMSVLGTSALFPCMALFLLGLVAFGFWCRRARDPLTSEEKDEFINVTRSTPEVFEIDPRSGIDAETEGTPA